MRKDLDRFMQERGIAGLVVFAYDRYSTAMHYLTGQNIHDALYFRAADGRAHLIVNPMERDQAALAGCEYSTFPQHGLIKLVAAEGHAAGGYARLIAETCGSLGIRGPVVFYGDVAAGFGHQLVERTLELDREVTADRSQPDLLELARLTKDEAEIAAIRRASQDTAAVMNALRGHLASLRRDGEGFRADGRGPVTLGDLRRFVHHAFMDYGLAEDGESIISQGRDAGVPHNRGNDGEPLRAGTPLLVDIFPGEAGGGYHSDMTRTFCLGRAPEPLQRLHGEVWGAFRLAMDSLALGAPCREYQEKVCGYFEQRGHATLRTNETTEEGYCHSLGHGVGLSVHEAPRLGGPPSNTQPIVPGLVISVEPGLYYPSRGMGVRIEDLVAVRADGTFENLTPAPYELEIEPRG